MPASECGGASDSRGIAVQELWLGKREHLASLGRRHLLVFEASNPPFSG